jgi:hypothetical protein
MGEAIAHLGFDFFVDLAIALSIIPIAAIMVAVGTTNGPFRMVIYSSIFLALICSAFVDISHNAIFDQTTILDRIIELIFRFTSAMAWGSGSWLLFRWLRARRSQERSIHSK